jgi:hypothetical protein
VSTKLSHPLQEQRTRDAYCSVFMCVALSFNDCLIHCLLSSILLLLVHLVNESCRTKSFVVFVDIKLWISKLLEDSPGEEQR